MKIAFGVIFAISAFFLFAVTMLCGMSVLMNYVNWGVLYIDSESAARAFDVWFGFALACSGLGVIFFGVLKDESDE